MACKITYSHKISDHNFIMFVPLKVNFHFQISKQGCNALNNGYFGYQGTCMYDLWLCQK